VQDGRIFIELINWPFLHVNISFTGKATDDPDFGAGDRCLNLPVGFSDPLWLVEYDARRFSHPTNMAPNRVNCYASDLRQTLSRCLTTQ
jgi:hypothetical protein